MIGWRIRGERCSRRESGLYGVLFAAASAMVFLLVVTTAKAVGNFPPPTGKVLLIAKGAITLTNVGAEAHLDREGLESIGMTKIVTRTPWTRGETVFEGVLARDVMRVLGATGKTAQAIAANDYKVTIPLTDFERYDVLLATRIDGKRLSLRTRGPIWIIYPDDADILDREREERMIWQLVELRIQ